MYRVRLSLAGTLQALNPGDRAARLGPGPRYWVGDGRQSEATVPLGFGRARTTFWLRISNFRCWHNYLFPALGGNDLSQSSPTRHYQARNSTIRTCQTLDR